MVTPGVSNFALGRAIDNHSTGSPAGFAAVPSLVQTALVGSLAASATTINCTSASSFPSAGYAAIGTGNGDTNVFAYTGTTSTTFTGVTGITNSYIAGAKIAAIVTSFGFNAHSQAISALESVLAGQGSLPAIVNGGFPCWQDGTSFATIADGTWTADNWIYRKSGAAVHTVARSTDVPSVGTIYPLQNYSLHLDVTTADASIAAGDFAVIATRIEGYNWAPFAQRTFTVGFWVKAAKTGTHCVYFRNSGGDRSYVAEYTVSVADTWEYKYVTVTASPSAGTWDYTNGRGIEIGWTQYAGSTFQTTASAWQTGDFHATSSQVNEVDNTANNFKIAMPTIAAGSFPAAFVQLPISLEDYRCKRYNEVQGGFSVATYGAGVVTSTTTADFVIPVVPKRSNPSVAVVGTVGDLHVFGSGFEISATGISSLSSGPTSVFTRAAISGGTAGQPCLLITGSGLTGALRYASRIA